jgi:glycosyltransferase involved in cell wall biosynthesis
MNNRLTIIIPAFNEELGIESTIRKVLPLAQKHNWIILVINDGSVDKTAGVLKKLSGIEIIDHPYNKGYGASLKTGILQAETELIAFYDADGQHNPDDLENLFNNFQNYDMLIGMRAKNSHQDWLRRPGKWVLTKVANLLTGNKIPDLNSGLRIIRRDIIIKMLHLFPQGFSFSTTSTIAFMNLGYNVGYYPIVVNKRVGTSTVKQFKHGSASIMLMLRLIVLFNPLKVFMPACIFLFIFGTIYEIIFGIILLLPDNFRLIPAAFFMILTSILIFFFGLVVDQISELRKHQFDK